MESGWRIAALPMRALGLSPMALPAELAPA